MDAYVRYTTLGKKILPVVLPSMLEAEKFSDHPLLILFYHENWLPTLWPIPTTMKVQKNALHNVAIYFTDISY
jgi:hypothetical protein